MKPLWGNMGISQRFVGQHSKNGLKGENNCATCPVLLPQEKTSSYSGETLRHTVNFLLYWCSTLHCAPAYRNQVSSRPLPELKQFAMFKSISEQYDSST